jgi:hypothetical protein
MGPIEHDICQIAFKIEKKYQDNDFKDQVLSIASLIHSVELPPKDRETNKDLKLIERIANEIIEEIK